MREILEHAAPFTWLLLGASALGSFAALAALIALSRRPRAAQWLAAGAIFFAVGCSSLGAADAWRALSTVSAERVYDADILSPQQRRRLRRAYVQAQAPARLALLASAFPLVAGAALMFAAARRRVALAAPPADPDIPFTPRAKLGIPVVFSLAGFVAAALPASALYDRIPDDDPIAARAADHLDADLARVHKAAEHEDILAACASLEDDLDARSDSLDPGVIPELPAAARRCVEEQIQHALLNQHVDSIRWQLRDLQRGVLVESDPELRRLVESAAAEVANLPLSYR